DPVEVLHFNRSLEEDATHYTGQNCLDCHDHAATVAFEPSDCDTCHGDGAGSNWPQTVATTASIHPDRAGAHDKHVTAIETGNSSCRTCHPGNPPVGHPDLIATGTSLAELSQMDTNGDSVADTWLSTYIKNSIGATDTDAYYNVVAQACGSVDCHSGSTTPDWYSGGPLDCNSCHLSHPGTGQHKKHANTNMNYSECDNCHGDATWSPSGNATGGSAYTTGGPAGSPHNDGVKTLYFPNNNAIWNSPNCTNVDCHPDPGSYKWW
ncbi:MAG: CxxxxCH/CxxCH domain-containing protein, partial [bacterium]